MSSLICFLGQGGGTIVERIKVRSDTFANGINIKVKPCTQHGVMSFCILYGEAISTMS